MEPLDVERLLRLRSRELARDPRRSLGRALGLERLRAERSRERASERRRAGLFALTALAAGVALWLLLSRPTQRSLGTLDAQVALLDAQGREIDSAPIVRGDKSAFVRPARALVEVAARSSGYAAIVMVDAQGLVHSPADGAAIAVGPDRAAALSFELGALALNPSGSSEVSWLVISAPRAFLVMDFELPEKLAAQGEARALALEQLRMRIAAELGCSVELRSLLLEPGS